MDLFPGWGGLISQQNLSEKPFYLPSWKSRRKKRSFGWDQLKQRETIMIETQSKYPRSEYMEAPRSACPGCALPLALRYFLKVMGEKVVFILPPGCSPVIVNVPRR